MDEDVEARIDELYALPLERFVAERDVLARELRAAGAREDAARVAGLGKPSIPAWAVNQVVRTQGKAARELWEAGDEILAVQDRVVAGKGSGPDLRAAVDRERAALAVLGGAARGLVTGGGRFLGDPNVQIVTETLHAAAVDPSVRPEVALGRATRPLQVSGLGGASSATPPARGRPAKSTRDAGTTEAAPSPPARRLAERKRSDEVAQTERRRAERAERDRLAAAQKALVRAEHARDAERRQIADGARARDAAAERVEAAMAELGRAEDELGRTEQALEARHAALERAEAAVDAARADVDGAG